MSDLTLAVEISGGVFALMMATQYGTRKFALHKLGLAAVSVVGFGYYYLKDAPTTHSSMVAYAIAITIGLVGAAFATATTKMWADQSSGQIMTKCGVGFAAVWIIAALARIGFVWAVSDISSFRNWFGVHVLMHYNLSPAVIAPFFLLWALTMVIVRVGILLGRSRTLKARQAQNAPVPVFAYI